MIRIVISSSGRDTPDGYGVAWQIMTPRWRTLPHPIDRPIRVAGVRLPIRRVAPGTRPRPHLLRASRAPPRRGARDHRGAVRDVAAPRAATTRRTGRTARR